MPMHFDKGHATPRFQQHYRWSNQSAQASNQEFLAVMLFHKHQIVFIHGNLRFQNIIVKDGNIGISDWDFNGWYLEYWEFEVEK